MVKKRKDVKMNTTISTLNKYDGKEVTLNGWVYNIRSVGKIWFLILRDGTGLVQCVVVNKETDSDYLIEEVRDILSNWYSTKFFEIKNPKNNSICLLYTSPSPRDRG